MGVNSLPKTVTRQRRDCDLNLGPSEPESSTLTARLYTEPPFGRLITDANKVPSRPLVVEMTPMQGARCVRGR